MIATDLNLVAKFRRSLSTKLLTLTIVFVLLAEIVVLIPSVAKQRMDWLHERVEASYVVGLALDSKFGELIAPEDQRALFATANIIGVVVEHDGKRFPIMIPETSPDQLQIKQTVYLDEMIAPQMIVEAWGNLTSTGNRSIRVIGSARYASDGRVDIIVSEAALRANLQLYARNVSLLSLLISTLTAGLVFGSLNFMIVRPVKRLTRSMSAFENDPEDPKALVSLSERSDEIGGAEQSLLALETRTQSLLSERKRLAALGAGISKISHDLRNILASAQLMSDRLAASDDPRVRKLSPRLISALDRAISLSRDTLNYARMEPTNLNRSPCNLRKIVADVLGDVATGEIIFENSIDDEISLYADKTQLYRAFFNIVKNAAEAIMPSDETAHRAESAQPTIEVRAKKARNAVFVDVLDNGPGLPDVARKDLFEPFKGSFKPGGSGLGIAIAQEIARAHGGGLELLKSDGTGTIFRFKLPLENEPSTG